MKIFDLIFGLFLLLANNEEKRVYNEEEMLHRQRVLECVERLAPVYIERKATIAVAKVCKESIEKGVDPVMVTAIGIVESGLHGGCWGDINNVFCIRGGVYNSTEDSVDSVVRLLQDKGQSVEDISRWYCPPTHVEWTSKVEHLMLEFRK